MKLSWLPVSCFRQLISGEMPIEVWLDQAVALGLDAVDASIIFFRDKGKVSPDRFRDEAEKRGLQVAVMNTYPDFTNPDKQIRQKEIEQFRSDVRIAAGINARMIRVTAGQAHPGLERQTGIEHAVDCLSRAAGIAQEAGVCPVFENHSKPGVWDYADFAHPADVFLELTGRLENLPLGILFDTANADARGDDPLMILNDVVQQVKCVHIADTAVRGKLKPTVIGQGIVDFDSIIGVLKGHAYDGWFSIEEASGQTPGGIEKAVEFIRQNWNS